ncbi:hypothetical protein LTR62_007314 [Meristemomyces frigidus]|uniref:Uncharacterized protein n=1 Tax=Meristemomyces frigidus TaxID=1508187 RepID=A0AAN7YJ39_9PEZI|nr:hypothetical protein LTR62_007314 [Meristemomyces frigidus]
MASQGNRTPRSSSRSRRSTTNLANLRLARLTTTTYTEAQPAKQSITAPSPYERAQEDNYLHQHSSYIQGRSAPSTPGILSRTSSRRHLGGGLSRRGSLYDDEIQYIYGAARQHDNNDTAQSSPAALPKAKSEAALQTYRQPTRLSNRNFPLRTRLNAPLSGRTSGSTTPRARIRSSADEDDWLLRTRATTNSILQEAKGQSWLASRDSSLHLASHLESSSEDDNDDEHSREENPEADGEVDEGYEEMAAFSRGSFLHPAREGVGSGRVGEGGMSPEERRKGSVRSPLHSGWGSRYGSRNPSRRTSRRGSMTSLQTNLVSGAARGQDGAADYFATAPSSVAVSGIVPDIVDVHDELEGSNAEEDVVARLSDQRGLGLGGFVERVMNFRLFSVQEGREESGDEGDRYAERRVDGVGGRKDARDELMREVPTAATRAREPPVEGEGRWQDAAWLLGVASKALF